jgi:hypothetical protein
MRLRTRTRSAATVVAVACASGMLVAGGQSPASAIEADPWTIPAMQVAPVPAAQSGEVVVWGDNSRGQLNVPDAVRGLAISQVVTGGFSAVLALTASGKVLGWGSSEALLEVPSPQLAGKRVTQIAISPGDAYAGAVTQDGKVVAWGKATAGDNPTDVPASAANVRQLALTNENAIAVRSDHTVVAWGDREDVNQVPAGLLATSVVATPTAAYALTTAGTVVAWGQNTNFQLALPAEVSVPGNVVAISPAGFGGIAQLVDGSLVGWGIKYRTVAGVSRGPVLPDTLTGQSIIAFDAPARSDDGWVVVLDGAGVLHAWEPVASPSEVEELPSALTGAPIVQFSTRSGTNGAAVVTKVLPAAAPVVAGTARAGGSLTATPSAFSGLPDSVTGQWLVNGVATGNASTTLALTTGLVGKTVAYVSTAVKGGVAVSTSSSAPVAVGAALAPVKVGSVTKVASVKAAKKGVKVTVVGKVTASKSPTGTAVVAITKGKKKIVAKTVKVSAAGAISLTVAKFNKLALKGVRGKSKKRYRGTYTVAISYSGNPGVKPSQAKRTFKVN